jgi:hypothetical protein
MPKKLLIYFLFIFSQEAFATVEHRSIKAQRISSAPKIDAVFDDDCWKHAAIASGFTELRPSAGSKEREQLKTEVYIAYDNTAMYIGAHLYDVSPDSIHHELSKRDDIGSADLFAVFLDTYDQRQTGFGFFVTPSGVQFDARYTNDNNNGEDGSWNAVWESNARINGNDWYAEMKIPYSALRFPKKPIQTWGINFMRKRDVSYEQLFWNPIDPAANGFITQWGEMSNIENIEPPLRLSVSPYFSSYVDNYPYNTNGIKNTTTTINGGADLKLGLSRSFTLDMTLIPDFGQVQSDNRVLNLSPFEIKYNENRSFFTEGTELFSKGNFFYSRRIGGTPVNYYDAESQLKPGETILKNPAETKLINATKVSGRTGSGLGIGVFNAITQPTYAVAQQEGGSNRNIETSPLSNYNILVFDQALKNCSSATIINTNVIRNGSTYDANVTGGLLSLNNKKNSYNLTLKGATSKLYNSNSQNINGYHYLVGGSKTSGNFNFGITQTFYDNKYNPNDLGILFNNNEIDNEAYANYNIYKPGKWYNRTNTGGGFLYIMRDAPRQFQNTYIYFWNYTQYKNFWWSNINVDINPVTTNDFYEARQDGKVYKELPYYGLGINVGTNSAKKYFISTSFYGKTKNRFNGYGADVDVYQNYRFTDHFAVSYEVSFNPRINYAGWVATDSDNKIIFAKRDRKTIENVLSFKYTFNNAMGIAARARHYFSNVNNKLYYSLLDDGNLAPNSSFNQNTNINYNLFNIDFAYSWRFAPGSELDIVWKNNIQTDDDLLVNSYFKNLDNTISAKQLNSFSVKMLYYIDYNSVKHKI